MEFIEWALLSLIPGVGLLVLWLVLERWGRKRDPMGGSLRGHWRTTGGTTSRRRDDE